MRNPIGIAMGTSSSRQEARMERSNANGMLLSGPTDRIDLALQLPQTIRLSWTKAAIGQ